MRGRRPQPQKPINEAIKTQLDTLDYATAFQASNDQAFQAAEMIAAMAPGDLNKVLFCNSARKRRTPPLKVALVPPCRGEGHLQHFIGREGLPRRRLWRLSVGGIPANRRCLAPAAALGWTTCASSTTR